MTARPFLLAVLLLVSLAAAPAVAGDAPSPAPGADGAPPVPCRVALIPAHRVSVEREVVVPAVTEEVQVPVYETVKVPVYGTLTWTETRTVEVPRAERRKKAVRVEIPNPFKCWKKAKIKVWDREVCEEAGTETREEIVERSEQVVIGEREEVRLVGHRTECVVVVPARTETVRECVELPDEWVTLGPPGTPPLPGTRTTMTEAQYRSVLLSTLR